MERFKQIVPTTKNGCSLKYEYLTNARTTAFNICGGKSFRYPENIADQLGIQMKYFVLQIFHKANDPVTFTLTILNTKNTVMKFSLSTLVRKHQQLITSKPTTRAIKVHIPTIPHDEWVNLCVDLEYIVMKNAPGDSFDSLLSFEIFPTCLIRNVFASPNPLRPEVNGQDLPNKFKYTGLKSTTILIAENAPKSNSKSRIPLRSQGAKVKPKIAPPKPKRPKTVIETEKEPIEDDFDEGALYDEEDTDDENGAFMGSPPKINKTDLNIQNSLPENEEEELELVFIEALNCYYCPNNQQYYQIDD